MFIRDAALTAMITLGLATAVQAQSVDIDFEGETLGTPIDGLALQNVLFQFFVGGASSGDATIAAYPLTCTTYLCGTVVEGTTEGGAQLVLNFLNPLSSVEFGLAVATDAATFANVTLFDPDGASLGTTMFELAPREPFLFSEGLFEAGPTPLGRVEIDLSPADFAVRFAMDNVRGRTVSVPEPATLLMMTWGVFLLSVIAWRRREELIQV